MNKKTIIIIAVLIIAFVASGVWYEKNKSTIIEGKNIEKSVIKEKNNQSIPKELQQESDLKEGTVSNENNEPLNTDGEYSELVDDNYNFPIDVRKWKTFKSDKYGFEIKYPNEFKLMEQSSSLKDKDNVHLYFPGITDENKFICPTLGLDIYKNIGYFESFSDILSKKDKRGFSIVEDYKFKNSKEILINGEKFLISEIERGVDDKHEFLNAIVVKNNDLYLIQMGSDAGGMPINKHCRDIYYTFLNSINFF